MPYQKASLQNNVIKGTIDILDIQYGNVWTNIDGDLFKQLKPTIWDVFSVTIYQNNIKKYEGTMPYMATFGGVLKGKPLLYLNSLLQVSVALNMANFSVTNKVYSGNDWTVEVKKL